MDTCNLAEFIRNTGAHVTIHGRTFTVSNIQSGGTIGWTARMAGPRTTFMALQTVPTTVRDDPEAERWFVLVGRKAMYFAVRKDGIRDLR